MSWEYDTALIDSWDIKKDDEEMAKRAKDRWELVTVVTIPQTTVSGDRYTARIHYYRREVTA